MMIRDEYLLYNFTRIMCSFTCSVITMNKASLFRANCKNGCSLKAIIPQLVQRQRLNISLRNYLVSSKGIICFDCEIKRETVSQQKSNKGNKNNCDFHYHLYVHVPQLGWHIYVYNLSPWAPAIYLVILLTNWSYVSVPCKSPSLCSLDWSVSAEIFICWVSLFWMESARLLHWSTCGGGIVEPQSYAQQKQTGK